MDNTNDFKNYIMTKCLIGYGIINGIINAIIFYFMERSHLDDVFYFQDILIDIAFTTVLLGIILALIVVPMTIKDARNQKFKVDKQENKIEKIIPDNKVLAYLFIGFVTCIVSVIVTAVVVGLFNLAPFNVMQMMVFKGIICAIAGATAGYLCIIKVAYSYALQ